MSGTLLATPLDHLFLSNGLDNFHLPMFSQEAQNAVEHRPIAATCLSEWLEECLPKDLRSRCLKNLENFGDLVCGVKYIGLINDSL
jgi:hypothetical protein